MKRALSFCSLLLLIHASGAQAQLYKWIGPDGKVTYSDTPPPATAKQIETKSVNAGSPSQAELPFELAEAVKSNPVTLYTAANCAACAEGRNLLNSRGIPFSEKTVSTGDDLALLKQAGGGTQVPFLTIGRNRQQGFETATWNGLLSAAGYPETNRLPKIYRNPQAEAASPKSAAGKTERSGNVERIADHPASSELPPAVGNAPPGFRF